MTKNEALARCRLFWARFVKIYGTDKKQFGLHKIYLFEKMFPQHVKNVWPHCFACHYNLERPNSDHCYSKCVIPWGVGYGCTHFTSPYWNEDAQGILNCVDKAIKEYDKTYK